MPQRVLTCIAVGLTAVVYSLPAARFVNAGELQYPLAVTANDDGVIFVADRDLPGIWSIKGGTVEKFFEGSKTFGTPLNAVRCLAIDHEGNLLAGDTSTRDVYRFDDHGKPVPLTNGRIGMPMSITVAKDGTLFVADIEVHRIWKVPAAGGEPEDFAVIKAPRGIAMDKEGRLWVVSTSSSKGQLLRVLPDGTINALVKDRPFQFPHQIVLGPNETAFVTDNYMGGVWKVAADGSTSKHATGEPLVKPVGLGALGNALLVADPHARAVFRVAPDGKITTVAGP